MTDYVQKSVTWLRMYSQQVFEHTDPASTHASTDGTTSKDLNASESTTIFQLTFSRFLGYFLSANCFCRYNTVLKRDSSSVLIYRHSFNGIREPRFIFLFHALKLGWSLYIIYSVLLCNGILLNIKIL